MQNMIKYRPARIVIISDTYLILNKTISKSGQHAHVPVNKQKYNCH